jgi:DNA-binding SARP family transcriptional activator
VAGEAAVLSRRDEAELLLALGRARWRAARRDEADEAFAAATERAVALGDPVLQAHAALGGGFQSDYSGDALGDRTRRLTDALDALADTDHPLRARLLAMLAVHRFAAPAPPSAGRGDLGPTPAALVADASAMAERLGDEVAAGYAKVAFQVVRPGPDTLTRRLAECREVLDIARRHDDHGLALQGRFHLIGALLEAGDVRAIDVELAAQHRVVDQVAEPAYARHSLWFRCMRLIVDGRADEAERVATEGLVVAEAAGDPDAFLVYGGQLAIIRWLQGRVLELEPLWADLRRDDPANPLWTTTLAWLWATSGQLDAARGAIEAVGSLDGQPDDRHWLLTGAALAEAVAIVGDRERAAGLRERLLPYADRAVPVAMGIAFWGSVARPLGLLARTLGRTEEAIRHLETAISVTARLTARPWLAQAQLDLAETLVAAGLDADRVAELLNEAAATVEALDVVALRPQVAALSGRTGSAARLVEETASAAEPASAESAPTRPRVSVLGTFEVIGADGVAARWTSRKARVLLKVLVARRGAAVPREQLMDLLWPGEDPEVLANRLSVAVSTVRRALDPARSSAADHFLVSDRDAVRLRLDHLDVDLEAFLAKAGEGLAAWRRPDRRDEALMLLTAALALHRGEALADEPYADWALALRSEVRGVTVAAAHAVADLAEAAGDELLAVGSFRRILEIDPFDETAHRGVIRVLESLGAHGQAHQARQHYQATMADLGVG